MQFDKTLIAIHERGLLETFDLSLHAIRRYGWPLAVLFSLGAAPLLVLNHFLVGWILDVDFFDSYFYLEETEAIVRYLWDMTLLVVIEAPLASVFATKFLGDAVFVERPKLSLVIGDVLKLSGRIAWCQLLMRGILAACLLMLVLERNGDFNPGIEFFLLGGLAGYSCLMRAFRPFINEIVLLEQNPLVSSSERMITINQRSHHLHSPSSGDLFGRWIGSAVIAMMLSGTVFGTFLFVSGVFLNDWRPGPFMLLTAFPLSLWIVAGFMTVVRFLGYLDLRIRHEGWEVELLLRAEATRMQSHAS